MTQQSNSSKDSLAVPVAGTAQRMDVDPGSTSSEFVSHRRIPAWLLSFVFHLLIFLGLVFALATYQNGASEVENRSGGIVLVNQVSESTEYLSEGDVVETSQQTMSSESPPPSASDFELPPDLPGLESSPTKVTGAGDSLVESLPGADALIVGAEPTGTIGGKVTTEVFGVKGTGTRFVYVFDRSKSMQGFGSRPMLAARQQLLESIASLSDTNQFQIVFYNDTVKIFNPDGMPTMYFATEDIKKKARLFVSSVHPDGGTDHVNALKVAFRLKPDVIFLLTDAEGEFTSAELRDLGRFNRSGAIINAIEFGERRGSDGTLQSVANNSGGQYIFKDVHSLRIEGQ